MEIKGTKKIKKEQEGDTEEIKYRVRDYKILLCLQYWLI